MCSGWLLAFGYVVAMRFWLLAKGMLAVKCRFEVARMFCVIVRMLLCSC